MRFMIFLPVTVAAALCLFMVQFCARTVYIHFAEFKPATAEFKLAKSHSDIAGMEAAYQKQRLAHERSFDPLWFIPKRS